MSLTSSGNPSTLGQGVTFNLTLGGTQGAVTGTATFNDGSSAIAGCSNVAVSGGAASCTSECARATTLRPMAGARMRS